MTSQSVVCLRSVSCLSALLTYFVIQSEPKILRLVHVAIDSLFYSGDVKRYLLMFCLDPKNNFQKEISLHKILKSKISSDI